MWCFFFFFKQKTAYEMRISDWSSDVCSSDLARILPPLLFWSLFYMTWNTLKGEQYGPWYDWLRTLAQGPVVFHLWYLYAIVGIYLFVPFLRAIWNAAQPTEKIAYQIGRAPSELQSLMPISYAVFFLKNK